MLHAPQQEVDGARLGGVGVGGAFLDRLQPGFQRLAELLGIGEAGVGVERRRAQRDRGQGLVHRCATRR